MARKSPHYMVDAYRQADRRSPAVRFESASIVASSDDEAVREADMVRIQFHPTFIVVRDGDRIIHRSEPVFPDA